MLGIWDMSHVAGIFNSTLGDNAIDAPNPNFGGGRIPPVPNGSTPWWYKIGSELLLTTNRTMYTRFRLVPKSITLDDLEGQ